MKTTYKSVNSLTIGEINRFENISSSTMMMLLIVPQNCKINMIVTAFIVLLAGQAVVGFNAPRLAQRQQIELRKNELTMVQLRLPTGLGLPSASSWMSGALRAIDTHNNDLTPRRDTALQLAAAGTGGGKSLVESVKSAIVSVVNFIVASILSVFRGIKQIFTFGGKPAKVLDEYDLLREKVTKRALANPG